MKNEILKKSIIIFFIITILMNYLLTLKVYAEVEIGDNTHLYGEKDCVSILQMKSTGGLKQVIKVYYQDPDTGKKLYAFCIEPSKPGVGTGATDFSGYETYIREKIQDQRIWRALYHGYIGVNWQDTSLECDDDWYYVTKTVIHCLVNNERPSDVYKVPSRIATSDTPYATLEDVQRRGQKALNECEKLYDYAINGTENYREATASIEKVGSFVSDGNNMVQTLKLTANKQIGSYDVKLANFPTGTTYSKSGNVVKIIVPKASITGDIKGTINILNAQVKTCPAFYGQSYNDTWQDYVTAADPYEIATAQATITFNTNNSTIKILKLDSETNKAVPNTTLKIEKDGQLINTVTTKDNGEAIIENLYPGTYKITEIKANDNYVLSKNPTKEVSVKYGETVTVKFDNTHKEGSLKIVKVDSRDNKTPIKNVTFEIWNVELNKKVATKTTGEDGTITIDNLRTGKYKVKETSTNEWYVLNTDEKIATVEYNKTTTLTIENDVKVGYIEIIKQDKDYSNIKLENVEFKILNSKGEVVDTLTTNKDGYAKSKAIPLDETYFVKETKTTEKYILSTDIQKVTFIPADEGKSKKVTFENKHKEGNIKVFKVDADNNKIGIGGVEFELYSEEFKKLIGKYYTDSNGEITINNLRIGNYRLKETATNKWYHLGGETNVVVEYNKTKEVTIKNELKKGSVKVIKVDKDNNQIKIPNVVFEVLDKNNNVLEKIKTDENGIAITKKYPVRDYETLKLHEVETDKWYDLNNDITEVKLEIDKVQEVTIENKKKKGQIRVIKVDLDNNEVRLQNVEFEVLNQKGEVVDRLKTDKNGEAVTKRLPIDEQYTIREVKTLEKYVLTEETKTVTLKENQIEDIQFENEKKKGQIEVFKVDAENKEIKLEGVEFEVINSDNEVVEIIKTDKNGYAKTSRIPIGEYKIKEIKTDEMHILNNEIIKVDVTTDIVSRLDITNERIKGQIKIVKTSQDDSFISGAVVGTPIENVKFEVYDSNKNKVDEITTNKDGIAITKKLDKGSYIIKEIEAGKWYLLNENEFVTEIKTHEEIVQVDITNESEKPSVDIEKIGIIQTTANQEIRYDFYIKNTGNVPLNNFTWFDYLPTEYVKMSKLITGTYNQDLNYNIYYKTNLNDYKILAEDLNTQVNNYIDFSSIKLEEGEVITEFKVDFGTVDIGFESVINPYIFVTVNSNVKNEDAFTNKTRIEGYNDEYMVWDEDDHTTKVYEKEVTVKKLPRTGF